MVGSVCNCIELAAQVIGALTFQVGGNRTHLALFIAYDQTLFSKPSSRIRILVQCKAESRQVGPNVVRELEGTMIRALWNQIQARNQIRAEMPASAAVVGIIASQSGFSKHAMLHMRSSKLPMLCLHLAKRLTKCEDEKQLECRGFMWNDALASQEGPLQGRFEVAWTCVPKGMRAPGASPHPVMKLYRDGVQIA